MEEIKIGHAKWAPDSEYFRRKYEILDWAFRNSKASYPEISVAASLLIGDRVLKLELPHHSFFAKLKGSWKAAKAEWRKGQHRSLKT